MHQLKKFTCILLILSVFSFVLAAPVTVQEIREAWTDVVDEGNYVTIRSGKLAEDQEEVPLIAQAQQEPSSPDSEDSISSQHQGTPSAPSPASGTHPNLLSSTSETKQPLLSASGGTELSWNPEGAAALIQSGTSTQIQPASSSKSKSVSWDTMSEMITHSGRRYTEMLQTGQKAKPNQQLEKMTYLDRMILLKALSSPPKTQSKNIFGILNKVKFWR